ncbi:MAG: DNRLRE domain-containing protein [Caldilineaceae bacterium]
MIDSRFKRATYAVMFTAVLLLISLAATANGSPVLADGDAPPETPAAAAKPTRRPVLAGESLPADRTDVLIAEVMALASNVSETANVEAAHFTNCVSITGNNASVAVLTGITISDLTLSPGDEIAIFTPDGSICAGVQIWEGVNTAITAWGDDTQTPGTVDGLLSGQEMKYSIWDSSTGEEHEYCEAAYVSGPGLSNGFYEEDTVHLLASLDECRDSGQKSFKAIADAYVRSNYPKNNYGSKSDIRIKDAAADFYGYLKFNVQNLPNAVRKATLELYVLDASVDGGTAYGVRDTAWDEGTIDWNNAPPMEQQALGSAGKAPAGKWVALDVTQWVTGEGLVSLGVQSGSNDLVKYSSREGSSAPRLLVEYGPLPAPAAEFVADKVTVEVGEAVQFSDLSTGPPTSWAWNFGDGQGSTEQHPSHSYSSSGTYTVTLTANNSSGSDVETKVNYITVSETVPVVCMEADADAFVRSNYPRNNFGTRNDIRIKDAAADFYGYLKFNVQGVSGAVQKATMRLYALDASVDGGTAYQVVETSWDEASITWNNAPAMGQALGSAGKVTIGQWAEVDVTAVVTANGPVSLGIKSGTKDLARYSSREGANGPQLCVEYQSGPLPQPAADFSADVTSGQAPLMVQYTDLSTGFPSSWAWDFGDGGGSQAQNPSHEYKNPGTYTVTLTASNSTGSDTQTRINYITVSEPPPIVCLAAAADAFVRSNYPTNNYGTRSDIRVKDAAADIHGYLLFPVEGVNGNVTGAALRLFVNDESVDGGTAYLVSDTSWDEASITWKNAPAMGMALDSAGAVTDGQWVEFDVTTAVSGNGLVSFGISSGSRDVVIYSSKEGPNVPELCVSFQ